MACSAESVPETFNAQAKADRDAARERAADQVAERAGFAPDQPAPLEIPSIEPPRIATPGSALPDRNRQYRYIGRWAAAPALCANGVWQFRTRDLASAGGVNCNLPNVAAVPSGFELDGTCRAGGKNVPQTLKLTFDEARHIMHVAGKTLGPADLIYCGN